MISDELKLGKFSNWWSTSLKNRESDIRAKIADHGKYSKKDLAYSDYNYYMGNAMCKNCAFYDSNGQPCQVIKEPIKSQGLCHFITGKSNMHFLIESVYAVLPPNGTWYLLAAGIATGVAVGVYKAVKKKK